MLTSSPLANEPGGAVEAPSRESNFDLTGVLRILRRQWMLISSVAAVCVFISLCYILTTQPRFTATAEIMIDTRKNQLMANQQVVGDPLLDTGGVDSQAEILKSESVALAVVRDLKLTDDPDFNGEPGLLSTLITKVSGEADGMSVFERERAAINRFAKNLTVKRVSTTYVIELSFTCFNAQKAAQITNALAETYMVNELESRYQATRRASRWLQDRIKELREQATEADRAVQRFRAENNIVDTSRGLLSEQQLGDVNGQLITARAATAEAKARLDRITEIGNNSVPNASVADALKSEVITRLRAQYLDLSAREADWSSRYGAAHTATNNLRNQMREIGRSIKDELQRIAESYRSEYEIARTREQSIQSSLATLVDSAGVSGQAQVKLRELESSAQTYRNLYDNFLQRLMEATQQQNFPVSEARLITTATAPLKKSWPKGLFILAGASFAGLLFGAGAGILRERLDNAFRTTRDVEIETGVECLGILPRISRLAENLEEAPRAITFSPLARYVLDAPFSRFAETIRGIKVATDLSGLTRRNKVIGIVSSIPNEGKTTVAVNLAQMIAWSGSRVLLVDCDLRNPSMTKLLAPNSHTGLVQVLGGQSAISDALLHDHDSEIDFVPTRFSTRLWHTAELVSSSAMAKFIEEARARYDYVILDLPPLMPVVDVRAMCHLIDGFVMVVEWGRTSRDVVREALAFVPPMRERLVGIVLNKANATVLKRLESYRGRYYNSYYRDERKSSRVA